MLRYFGSSCRVRLAKYLFLMDQSMINSIRKRRENLKSSIASLD